MGTQSILVVNHHGRMNQAERQQLEQQGYLVKETSLDFRPPAGADHAIYDLFILNLNSAAIDTDYCTRWIPPQRSVPVIVLTTCSDNRATIALLDAGADDILMRPISLREMMARIRAVLRRAQHSYITEPYQPSIVQLADVKIHLTGRRVFVDGVEIRLTRTEFNLLSTMLGRLDKVCSHGELLARVWGWEYWDATQYLYVYMGRLRRKLGDGYASLLETVPGIGYVLHSDQDVSEACLLS
jgi:DNA-binding response OmpR family regulator